MGLMGFYTYTDAWINFITLLQKHGVQRRQPISEVVSSIVWVMINFKKTHKLECPSQSKQDLIGELWNN